MVRIISLPLLAAITAWIAQTNKGGNGHQLEQKHSDEFHAAGKAGRVMEDGSAIADRSARLSQRCTAAIRLLLAPPTGSSPALQVALFLPNGTLRFLRREDQDGARASATPPPPPRVGVACGEGAAYLGGVATLALMAHAAYGT